MNKFNDIWTSPLHYKLEVSNRIQPTFYLWFNYFNPRYLSEQTKNTTITTTKTKQKDSLGYIKPKFMPAAIWLPTNSTGRSKPETGN